MALQVAAAPPASGGLHPSAVWTLDPMSHDDGEPRRVTVRRGAARLVVTPPQVRRGDIISTPDGQRLRDRRLRKQRSTG